MDIQERLEKARLEVNGLRNAASRALYAIDRAMEGVEPTPAPTVPPPGQWIKTADVPAIAPNFDVEEDIRLTTPLKQGGETGKLRLHMGITHHSRADPVVGPGLIGPHDHTWYGNPLVNEKTTRESLVTDGVSSGEGGRINRSLYGFSSIIVEDMAGKLWKLTPKHAVNYYQLAPKTSGVWTSYPEFIPSVMPRGLRMVTGQKFYPDPESWRWPHVPPARAHLHGGGSPAGHHSNLDNLVADWNAPDRFLNIDFTFPNMWDGEHSDSPDHVAHMRWLNGHARPLPSHSHVIPTLSFHVDYEHPGFPVKRIYASSDLDGDTIREPGSTLHAYFMDGWVDEWRQKMFDHTFNGFDTSNGTFFDGRSLKWRDESTWLRQGPVAYEP